MRLCYKCQMLLEGSGYVVLPEPFTNRKDHFGKCENCGAKTGEKVIVLQHKKEREE